MLRKERGKEGRIKEVRERNEINKGKGRLREESTEGEEAPSHSHSNSYHHLLTLSLHNQISFFFQIPVTPLDS